MKISFRYPYFIKGYLPLHVNLHVSNPNELITFLLSYFFLLAYPKILLPMELKSKCIR